MKAIIAIDSFKGCLSSEDAEEAALESFSPGEAIAIPVSDGGEGFSSIVTRMLGGTFKTVSCSDPVGRPIKAAYGLVRHGRTAVIETAAASGLCLLKQSELNPFSASTYGTGELISDALNEGVEEVWLGLGGSATCDGGTGLLQALGYSFITRNGKLENGRTVLGSIQSIDSSRRHKALSDCRITGFYDVSIPFWGKGGSARLYAPQKGAGPEMVEALDEWMCQLCGVYSRFSGREVKNLPGAGAAGGIGGALEAVLDAKMEPGVCHVLGLSGIGSALDECGLVITGEGHADLQTLGGKVPMGVLEYVREHDSESKRQSKVILIAGQVSDREKLVNAGFDDVIQTTPEKMSLKEAMIPSAARANIKSALHGLATLQH